MPVIPAIAANNVSLWDALKLVCRVTKFKFVIEEGPVVMVMPEGMTTEALTTVLKDLNPQTAGMMETYITEDRLTEDYGLNQEQSTTAAPLISDVFGYWNEPGVAENMTEEEFAFISEYATIVKILKDITLDPIAEVTLADVIHTGTYTYKDLYPIAAALTKGQMALVKMGLLETILQYGAPSASPEELNQVLDEYIAEVNQEQNNIFSKGIDVYTGVDRSIFKGSLAMTTAATRQQALTGETWDISKATDNGVVEAAKIIAII